MFSVVPGQTNLDQGGVMSTQDTEHELGKAEVPFLVPVVTPPPRLMMFALAPVSTSAASSLVPLGNESVARSNKRCGKEETEV